MQESGIFKQASFYRSMTLMNVRHVTEEMADQQPGGFNNTIRWNVGHILSAQDAMLTSALGRESYLPESYAKLFAPGTKPSEWSNDEVPDLKTLYRALKDQEETLKEVLAGKLSEEAVKPFRLGEWIEMPTLGEIYNFSLFHEGMHISTIKHISSNLTK
ncbi:DinB family protein [Anaerobacillus alkaliphilus]|uniref:DinB family protein n=1 Tax=Anaerobacillus alkaliphilus TaxID=1548597 RepID=A0A4Q0VYE4_9BACI|nr:DinB family protein [Anaerobacillus alkaliphilus]RXJ04579.1 DinB family protein [Anaerobacillus alkaliphilus]